MSMAPQTESLEGSSSLSLVQYLAQKQDTSSSIQYSTQKQNTSSSSSVQYPAQKQGTSSSLAQFPAPKQGTSLSSSVQYPTRKQSTSQNSARKQCTSLIRNHNVCFSLWILLLLDSLLSQTVLASKNLLFVAKPGCIDQCGNISIPYPFGMGKDCYHDTWYEIICNSSFDPPKPFLYRVDFEVVDINWSGRYRNQQELAEDEQILKVIMAPQNVCEPNNEIDIRQSPYRFLRKDNVMLVEGCSGNVVLTDGLNETLAECESVCSGNGTKNECKTGKGCCLAPLNLLITSFGYMKMGLSLDQRTRSVSSGCNTVAWLIDNSSAQAQQSYGIGNSTNQQVQQHTTVLRWWASYLSSFSFDNVTCVGSSELQTCHCNFPYEGNPYLPNGCQVARECRKCRDRCHSNTSRAYYCKKDPLKKLVGILCGIIVLLLLCCANIRCAAVCLRKRRLNKTKQIYFQKNGGVLLKQTIPLFQGGNESIRIFTSNELKLATKNYSQDNIIGKGGYGTVYKGFIQDQVIAIKRSELISENQVQQFINEILVLSQINHRNVVKLLGCCLETEIPLLVYEYVANGNLYDHIHNSGSKSGWLSWENCLRIATEAADAFAYLHSSASVPIIHRDIKSSNILLDENFTAKVSDFGASRLVPMNQTQVTTLVQGTLGYLDPEYFQSSHLSEKSDVYSFGVVLAELLTRRKPIIWEKGYEERNLVTHFLFAIRTGHLFSILATQLMIEATPEQLSAFAKLVARCLSLKGEYRPTMKEVVRELESLKNNEMIEELNLSSADVPSVHYNAQRTDDNSSGMYSINLVRI